MERNVFQNRIEEMSMGQRKKVELAKSLAQQADLYIWDEPLNYLDVFNQKQLEELLLQIKPTMLIVEHDQTFLETIQAQQIALKNKRNRPEKGRFLLFFTFIPSKKRLSSYGGFPIVPLEYPQKAALLFL